jgi:uncharacterized RDD family membrane protein YckC
VAPVGQRAAAGALDALIVFGAFLVFLGVHRLGAGEIVMRGASVFYFFAIYFVLLGFLKLFSAMRSDRSPGLRLLGLRLLHFDGRPPSRRQRVIRALAGYGSFAPFGIGLIWALLDEERLTMHDHISQTFITPDETNR